MTCSSRRVWRRRREKMPRETSMVKFIEEVAFRCLSNLCPVFPYRIEYSFVREGILVLLVLCTLHLIQNSKFVLQMERFLSERRVGIGVLHWSLG